MDMGIFVSATFWAIVAGFIRVIAGWVENALRDGKIEKFEWLQLLGTLAVFIGGINVLSLGLDPKTATVVWFILDVIRTALAKIAGGNSGSTQGSSQ
jgi:biotin transporter BioY